MARLLETLVKVPLASDYFGEQAAEIIWAILKQSLWIYSLTNARLDSRVSAMCWVVFGTVKRKNAYLPIWHYERGLSSVGVGAAVDVVCRLRWLWLLAAGC